jgi:hypothetical protein
MNGISISFKFRVKNNKWLPIIFARMNATLKTVLLTVLTLSLFALALVELSGVSRTALFNKWEENEVKPKVTTEEAKERDAQVKAMPKTQLEVDQKHHVFGTIKEGEKVEHTYKVKNTGSNPLMISSVVVSCGCTASDFTKERIPPGGEGWVTLVFNSAGKEGLVKKNAHIMANIDEVNFPISFEAQVQKK